MKFTNQYIESSKNQVLKNVLNSMKPQIEKKIESTIKWMESEKNAMPVTEFGKECIELQLIHDICKSIISYTNEDDMLLWFNAGTSVKGNFEMTGEIERGGKRYSFSTEAIIAGGYIQRDHYRYLTKTNLPKTGNMVLAKEIKKVIALKNKKQRKMDDISRLEKHIKNAYVKSDMLSKLTREDWIEYINANDANRFITNDNWSEFPQDHRDEIFQGSYEVYKQWIVDTNEKTIDRAMEESTHIVNRIAYLEKDLKKEQERLSKI